MQLSQVSRRVWTSYGIMMDVLPSFTPKELIYLQNINRFFYDIAVSRVQVVIKLPYTFYFTDSHSLVAY